MSFTYKFKYDNDKVYFALWKPYSYTRLENSYLRYEAILMRESPSADIKQEPDIEISSRDILYTRKQTYHSLGGIPVDLITITANSQYQIMDSDKKSYVVISARVHAGETAGSYKMQSIIRFFAFKRPSGCFSKAETYIFACPNGES